MLAPFFADLLRQTVPALRRVVAQARCTGWGCPALSAGLAWFDMMRTARQARPT
jgi:6-phosphogluconate dehydrogenase